MTVFELATEILLPRPREEVFAFFSQAENLDRLTPSTMRFVILTPAPVEMRPGAVIDYRLKVRGLPIRWRSEITAWEPPHRFVDEQRRGPYRLWVHEHRFEERDGGTLAIDRVRYAVPGGRLVNRLIVAPDLKRVFELRHRKLRELFGGRAEDAGAVVLRRCEGYSGRTSRPVRRSNSGGIASSSKPNAS